MGKSKDVAGRENLSLSPFLIDKKSQEQFMRVASFIRLSPKFDASR